MGIGAIAISTSQKREITPAPGPPFQLDSANNGLSVDAVTRKIVLGNDLGDLAAPAALLSDREIAMDDILFNAFDINLNAVNTTGVATVLSGGVVSVQALVQFGFPQIFCGSDSLDTVSADIICATNTNGTANILCRSNAAGGITTVAATTAASGVGGLATLRVGAGVNDVLDITSGSVAGRVQFRVRGLLTTMAINTTTLCTLFQSTESAPFNGATVQVSGTHTYRKFQQSQGAGTFNLDRDTDSAKVIRNSGALVITFPNMVGANFREGFFIDVLCNNAAGITINAGAGVLIRYGSLATSVNGTISTTDVGAYIRIQIIDGTTYNVCFSVGLWALT